MIGMGLIGDVKNMLSQNREAFFFHGCHRDFELGCVIKVLKASKSDLKRREVYIHGEWRFRYQEHHLNPNKMLKLWAEKEFRNLKRLCKSNIPCTVPISLKGHILTLQYSGENGTVAAPLATSMGQLSKSRRTELYWQAVCLVKQMYIQSSLIHAGLNPYTLLVADGHLLVSELGRAVINDHPHATHFLRHDCFSINKFFRGQVVDVLSTRKFYEFASHKEFDTNANQMFEGPSLQVQLERLQRSVANAVEPTRQELIDEMIWLQLDLPASLKDVFEPYDVPPDSVLQSAIDGLGLIK
jgi:RIO kinase 1